MLRCGRRWGKTSAALIATVKGHGKYRGQRIGAIDGGNIAWIGLTTKQTKKNWRQLKRATAGASVEKSEVDREVWLPGGGHIAVWSAQEPDNMRGDGLDGVVFDEGAFMKPEIWTHVIRPALSDTGGWALFPSTPNGANWFKDLSDNIEHGRIEDAEAWHRPSWDNPNIPISEFRDALTELGPVTFRQEYGADFVQAEGTEWPADYFGQHIWYDGEPPADHDCRVVSNDPSKGKTDKSDYTAFMKVTHDPRGIFWIDAEIERMDVSRIADRAVAICEEFRPHAIGFETNAFQELIGASFLEKANQRRLDVNYNAINNHINKRTRIRQLTPLLAAGRIKIKQNRGGIVLVDQLRQFPLPSAHDDGPDALEMGIRLTKSVMSER